MALMATLHTNVYLGVSQKGSFIACEFHYNFVELSLLLMPLNEDCCLICTNYVEFYSWEVVLSHVMVQITKLLQLYYS